MTTHAQPTCSNPKSDIRNRAHPKSVYLYCLIPAPLPSAVTGNSIDDDQPLFEHTFHGLSAIVSGVDLDAFTGTSSEHNLQDIHWVAPRAARHAEVVERMMAHSPVLPVRFGTIFSSPEALEDALERHQETIAAFLSELGNRKEYALKGFMDRKTALTTIADAALDEASQTLAAMAPGARYFEEKRLQRRSETVLNQWVQQAQLIIAGQLSTDGRNLAELKLQSRQASGHPLEMVFNWALLVTDHDRAATIERIAEINADWKPRGISLESSGPWPPYSFCPQLVWDEIS